MHVHGAASFSSGVRWHPRACVPWFCYSQYICALARCHVAGLLLHAQCFGAILWAWPCLRQHFPIAAEVPQLNEAAMSPQHCRANRSRWPGNQVLVGQWHACHPPCVSSVVCRDAAAARAGAAAADSMQVCAWRLCRCDVKLPPQRRACMHGPLLLFYTSVELAGL